MPRIGHSLRIGLIGASRIAVPAVIIPARALPGVEIVAVAARDSDRARAFADLHGIALALPSYADLIARPDIDLVYVATPPASHEALALQAIAAKKAVLVEKPFAMDARQAARVAAAARAASVPVFEGMHSLHHTLLHRVREIVTSGAIGEVTSMRARFDTPIADDPADFRWSAAQGGGALFDLGVYPLAWCRWIAGNAFRVADARATFYRGVDTSFSATLTFASGIVAQVSAAMVCDRHVARMDIECSRGRIEIENPLVPHLGHRLRIAGPAGEREERTAGPATYEAQLRAIRAALRGECLFPLPVDDFVHSMAAIDLVRSSVNQFADVFAPRDG